MEKTLLETLKKLPKERYEELTKELGTDFDAAKIKEGLAKEGVELTDEEATRLEIILLESLAAKSEVELSEEQLAMIAGGGKPSKGCV